MKVYIVMALEPMGGIPVSDRAYVHRADAEIELAQHAVGMNADQYEIQEFELVGAQEAQSNG